RRQGQQANLRPARSALRRRLRVPRVQSRRLRAGDGYRRPCIGRRPHQPPLMEERAAWLRLTLTPGIGSASQRALLAALGPPEQVLAASRTTLSGIVGAELAERLKAGPDATALDAAIAWLEEPDNHILTLADADYPPQLLEIPDPPTLLYIKGDASLLKQPALAIVGARSATPQGMDNARAFARSLADAGLVVVSGLALGIDTAAHRGPPEAD